MLAKGIECRAVAVIACDADVIPSPACLAAVSDPGDLKEAYDSSATSATSPAPSPAITSSSPASTPPPSS